MKIVRFDAGPDLERMEIHTFADLHLGDAFADEKLVIQRIAEVKSNPYAYLILNGDIINNATKTSVSDTYAEVIPPMQQIQKVIDLFGDVKDKIIAVTSGNHENRTYRTDGIDIMGLVCAQLGISDRYSKTGAFIFLQFGKSYAGGSNKKGKIREMMYTIYCIHGSGGGRKEGGKAIRLADLASIADSDIYIHSHTHLPMVMKQGFFRVDLASKTVQNVDKLFVNTSAMLDYGSYGEAFEFKPSSKDTPVIYLSSGTKRMTAKL